MSCSLKSTLACISRKFILSQMSKFQFGTITIKDANGRYYVCGNIALKQDDEDVEKIAANVLIEVQRPQVWTQMLLRGDLGFAEAYINAEIDCDNLPMLFELIIINRDTKKARPTIRSILNLLQRPVRVANDLNQASINANAHYSLSNEMFLAFLSPDMTYSCPLWIEDFASSGFYGTLEEAQYRKLRSVIEMAEISTADHVLEIGTGWASFAILASQITGCQVTTITLSNEQKKLAEKHIKMAGLDGKIKVLLCDYRRVSHTRPFDKIVSIEMIEAVGKDDIDTFFNCMGQYLKSKGGVMVLQAIVMPESSHHIRQGKEGFIEKYIFPGGYLPSISELRESIDKTSAGTLAVTRTRCIGSHYARALKIWRQTFEENFQHVIAPALGQKHPEMKVEDIEVFRRKWTYYFAYCEAGFKTGIIDDVMMKIECKSCQPQR